VSQAFICLLTLHLHFPEVTDLKGKRKHVSSLKALLSRRFGAAVAETDHQDLRQRVTLSIALVGGRQGEVSERADALQRFAEARLGELIAWDRRLVSKQDLER